MVNKIKKVSLLLKIFDQIYYYYYYYDLLFIQRNVIICKFYPEWDSVLGQLSLKIAKVPL